MRLAQRADPAALPPRSHNARALHHSRPNTYAARPHTTRATSASHILGPLVPTRGQLARHTLTLHPGGPTHRIAPYQIQPDTVPPAAATQLTHSPQREPTSTRERLS